MILVIMGVSGSGKTTVGKRVAGLLRCPFHDADDFHSAANILKMQSGIALDESDRAPWLHAIADAMRRWRSDHARTVLACSALKESHRQVLHGDDVNFVYLKGSAELLSERMRMRTGHFMPASLLRSQLQALEEPRDAFTVDILQTPEQCAQQIVCFISSQTSKTQS